MSAIKLHKAPRLGLPSNVPDCKYNDSLIFYKSIKAQQLISHLSSNYFEDTPFNAKNYINQDTSEVIENRTIKNDNLTVAKQRLSFDKKPASFDSMKKNIEDIDFKNLSKKFLLSRTVCFIETDISKNESSVNLDQANNRIFYFYNIYFKTSDQHVISISKKTTKNSKHKAITIRDDRVELLFFFLEKTYGKNEANNVRKDIHKRFIDELTSTTDVKRLVFLYNNLPEYIKRGYDSIEDAEQKPYKIQDDLLWKHFNLFVDYDKYNDASYYVLLTMTLMSPKFCIQEFRKNQAFVIEVYDGLDDRNLIDRFIGDYPYSETFEIDKNTFAPTNKDAFISLLNAYIQLYESDSSVAVFEPSAPHFHQGVHDMTPFTSDDSRKHYVTYTLDSNIVFSNTDENAGKVYISNKWNSKKGLGTALIQNPISNQVSTVTNYEFRRGYNEPEAYYNPLDLVKFTQYDNDGQPMTMNAPAIFVKYASDVKEWEKVNEGIRFGTNVLMIIAGAATIYSGVGSLMLYAAIADMGLASADIIVQAEKDKLSKTRGGRAFLEDWENIYTVGGIATFSPVAIKAVVTYGPKIITSGADLLQVTGKTITNPATYKRIKDITTKAINSIEIPNFNKTGLEILKMSFTSIPELKGALKLQKLGVIFAKGGENTIAAIYKGVAIVSGKVKDVGIKLNTAIKKLKGKNLEKYLDELVEVALDNIKGKGLYGGQILSKADLDLWAKNLLEKYGTKLEKVDNFDEPDILAQFDSNTNTIRYKEDVTEYIMTHESFHAQEMHEIRFEQYVKDAPLKGTKIKDYTDKNLWRSYRRELYVQEGMLKIAKEKKFTQLEIINISYNVDIYILELIKRGYNIKF